MPRWIDSEIDSEIESGIESGIETRMDERIGRGRSADPSDDARSRRRDRRGRSRRRREARTASEPADRVYEQAERRVQRKIAFMRQLFTYVLVLLLLLVLRSPFVLVSVVALAWGIPLGLRAFSIFVAPRLRERWVSREVELQVARQMSLQRRALEGEKTRSLEELSASIAHEIRNPVTAAKSLVQQMGEDPSSSENVEYAAVALEELERVERSISHLLRYARDEDLKRRTVRLPDVVEDALSVLSDRIDALQVRVVRDFDGAPELEADFEMLRRLFLNLIGNALDAFEEAGTPGPRIELAIGESLAGTEVWARVRDNGPGMEPEIRERAFRPFFTSKANGTGLGLAVCRKLVDAHGGTIELESSPGQGSEFVVTFPRHVPGGDA